MPLNYSTLRSSEYFPIFSNNKCITIIQPQTPHVNERFLNFIKHLWNCQVSANE